MAEIHRYNPTDLDLDMDELSVYILDNLSQENLERGDIVKSKTSSYRNEDTYIYDGSKIINLCGDIDPYGSVPPQFKFPEFGLDHWHYVIDHNFIAWLDLTNYPEIKEQLLDNLTNEHDNYYCGNGCKTHFVYDDKRYNILIPSPHCVVESTSPADILERYKEVIRNSKGLVDFDEDANIYVLIE